MPDLLHSLQNHDLGHLRIVAGLWGLELRSNELHAAIRELGAALSEEKPAREIIASLDADSQAGLKALARAGGRIPWAAFIRQFGEVREMGAGRRDREKPYLHPSSVAESLFYRGLLARAFFDSDQGPQEFAYLPDDWLPLFQQGEAGEAEAPGRRAAPADRGYSIPANDRILDHATTLLAAIRLGRATRPDPVLQGLLSEAGLLKRGSLQAEPVRTFLEAPRSGSLKMLVEAWRSSEKFNELRLVPGLICEGEWTNQPHLARKFLLKFLQAVPRATWWSLAAFIEDVRTKYPDFQRPAGDYDSWFIKSAADRRYLRGFADWEQVDGAMIRFLITNVMHRLGMLDLASPSEGEEPMAFRIAQHGERFPITEQGRLHVASQGWINAARLVPRAVRYQLARFCEWGEEKPEEYRYRVTPQSLSRAAKQGLKVEHLLTLLAKHADAGPPPALVKALKRWEAHGAEARAETQAILRVKRPEILEQLRKSRAARFLAEPLGPAAVVIKPGAQAKVMAALAEMGLLAQDDTTPSSKSDEDPIADEAGAQRPKIK